ncbi:ABC-type transport auxiliary lipoprotein family protein [Acidocella sp.]|uniref:ABC-type transport auxiliary lipoprotein family protein n=1 Tax=Acidocella sp. TaxID=50710 RepID=UPI00261D026B|nr:ABC-type transport auxiliary lipoprotein family protein [Acidocella sp.]MDD2795551.1 ABC-type transport auxiliary lipoprotein family protein [Acidocella sp.]
MNRRFACLALLALSACTSLLPAQKYIARTSWPLAPQPPAQNPANPSGPILMVRAISAAPGLDQTGLQSLAPDGSLNIDYYNNWAAAPADAATQALLTWCQASGAFSAVIQPGSRLNPGLIVEGELTQLLANPASGQATAVLTLAVIKPAGGITTAALPLVQQRITGAAPLVGATPAAQAAAQNAALASALVQAVALLTRYAR